ncbi:thaumatin-like protein [Lactarius quietus]|nr:thaumatin-like protein [Lactarius quietus]
MGQYFPEFTTNQLLTDSDPAPNQPAGWLAPSSSNVSFTVSDDWMGQIWGRRDCNFTTNPGADSCLDGGCPGGLLCTEPGQSPVTTAEFTLSTDTDIPDFYDISLINGFNMPMRIDNTADCGVPGCNVDLSANCQSCPLPLQEPYQPTGFPTGCNSACAAGLAPDPNNDPNCCTGKFDNSETCVTSGVQYYIYFKSNCPNTNVYIFDVVDSNPLFTCPSASKANYIVTFCSQND